MSQHYSNPARKSDPHALPDVEVFELTAQECAERDEDMIYEYMKRREFRLAGFNSRNRESMFDAMIEEEGITGGWFYWYCFPGCMPDSDAAMQWGRIRRGRKLSTLLRKIDNSPAH